MFFRPPGAAKNHAPGTFSSIFRAGRFQCVFYCVCCHFADTNAPGAVFDLRDLRDPQNFKNKLALVPPYPLGTVNVVSLDSIGR